MSDSESTPDQIRKQTRRLVRELGVVRSAYLGTGYTLAQCHVMFELFEHGPLSLMDLSKQLLLDKSNTSRTVKQLVQKELVHTGKVASDHRRVALSLTAKGKRALASIVSSANEQVEASLENLSKPQQQIAVEGMALYAGALTKARLQATYAIRPIRKRDNAKVAALIRAVMTEFGAVGEGYSIADPEVDDMHGSYQSDDSCFEVIAVGADIVGCGGIARLQGGDATTCELRKVFLDPSVRGVGLGRRLVLRLLDAARGRGHKRCYIETLGRMTEANALYLDMGFKPVSKPMGKTGHGQCDRHYLLTF